MTTEAVAIREADALPAWNPRQVVAQVDLVQQVMREVMREGEHFGVIPGTERKDKDGKDISKPSLLQPGAQKLCMTFRLAPEFNVEETALGNGHIDVKTVTVLRHIETGRIVGSGIGSCSTMESKYRWRKAERVCPACGKPAIIKGKEEYGGGWICFAKKGGCGAKYKAEDPAITQQMVGQTENPDVADTWNTVRKMSKKRSFVDATIQALAVSDLFTQDVEDFPPPPPPTTQAPTETNQPGPSSGEQEASDELRAEQHAIAVAEWIQALQNAESVEKLGALWKTLSAKKAWDTFTGEEQTAFIRAKDARKTALTAQPGTLV